ncbi:hypothetical protein NDU88_001430 [Pleurodeles waltl]|uniref:Uncharacterized protein n=1 Tax=Pleurodeles waltl TaxID=8319 RepID=A0AAV7L9S4_PLEWA|nr:hypothetical protein NDU88_001430 [Pleurodeles waltl]
MQTTNHSSYLHSVYLNTNGSNKLYAFRDKKSGSDAGNVLKEELVKKQLWDNLWKISKREHAKLWEATTLQKYVECDRIPRGLIIFTLRNIVDPDPDMIEEWMINNHNCSSGMLKILIKYARKDVEKLSQEIDKCMAMLKDNCSLEEYEKMSEDVDRSEYARAGELLYLNPSGCPEGVIKRT